MRRLVRPAWTLLRTKMVGAAEARIGALEKEWTRHAPVFSATSIRVNGLDVRANDLQAQFADLRENFNSTRHELKKSIEGHLAHQQRSLADMWERIEFMRREMLFEVKYGGLAGQQRDKEQITARVVNEEKLASAREKGLRLNLGCGHIALQGYVNVDQRELPNVDIVAEVGSLPLEPGSVHEITSAHLLEHFPQEELRRRLVPYWYALLVPQGKFRAIVPDGEAMFAGLAAGTYTFDDFREVLFGGQDYEGDFHFNLFTPDSLTKLLSEAGFYEVEIEEKGRRNGKCFEFQIVAIKPPTVAGRDEKSDMEAQKPEFQGRAVRR